MCDIVRVDYGSKFLGAVFVCLFVAPGFLSTEVQLGAKASS